MYGLVNRGLQDMVVSQHGEAVWREIMAAAGVEVDEFVGMTQYSDDITGRLVGAACARLDRSAETILEDFGEHWVLYTSKAGYGDLIQMAGGSFTGFLQNLDTLHARVGLSFPHLAPPSFRCTDETDTGLTLHYYSTRTGLTHLVIGLIRGLARMFHVEVRITPVALKGQGSDHDIFHVEYASV